MSLGPAWLQPWALGTHLTIATPPPCSVFELTWPPRFPKLEAWW